MSQLNNLNISEQDILLLELQENLSFDKQRKSILKSIGSIDVQACPGSGKTTLIAAKLMLLAKIWPYKYQGICVLSHTNVAKDEIINRLKNTEIAEAKKLISYPHFIGTIHDFINQYIAIPYLHSKGVKKIHLDNEYYTERVIKLLKTNGFMWLNNSLKGLGEEKNIVNFIKELHYILSLGKIDVNIKAKPQSWKKEESLHKAKSYLLSLKQSLLDDGLFLFRDMFTFALILIENNSYVADYLQTRFPFVFIDEMQDTQKYQDDLLQKIFPLTNKNISVQRFGDPDQAIFNGIGGEEPNDSYNIKTAEEMNFVINQSHRFDNSIASKIKNLSYNQIALQSELSEHHLAERNKEHNVNTLFNHALIIYNDESIKQVIDKFALIVSSEFSNAKKTSPKFIVKAIGAVGKNTDEDAKALTIAHYWDKFHKNKSSKFFKEKFLIEIIYHCRQSNEADWANNYKLLNLGVETLLRKNETLFRQNEYFNTENFKNYLESKQEWLNYRKHVYFLLSRSNTFNEALWQRFINYIRTTFEIQEWSEDAKIYLNFQENTDVEQSPAGLAQVGNTSNLIKHEDGFSIEFSTIHGVKGETHTATLVLETKFHRFDLEAMLPYLTGERPNINIPNSELKEEPHFRAKEKANKKFMRQLYVGMSRASHLLCLAMHKSRISKEAIEALEAKGWLIHKL